MLEFLQVISPKFKPPFNITVDAFNAIEIILSDENLRSDLSAKKHPENVSQPHSNDLNVPYQPLYSKIHSEQVVKAVCKEE